MLHFKVESGLDIQLVFSQNGKTLATRRIHAVTQGNPFGQTGKNYPNLTLNKALRETADYLGSVDFQDEVLGDGH